MHTYVRTWVQTYARGLRSLLSAAGWVACRPDRRRTGCGQGQVGGKGGHEYVRTYVCDALGRGGPAHHFSRSGRAHSRSQPKRERVLASPTGTSEGAHESIRNERPLTIPIQTRAGHDSTRNMITRSRFPSDRESPLTSPTAHNAPRTGSAPSRFHPNVSARGRIPSKRERPLTMPPEMVSGALRPRHNVSGCLRTIPTRNGGGCLQFPPETEACASDPPPS